MRRGMACSGRPLVLVGYALLVGWVLLVGCADDGHDVQDLFDRGLARIAEGDYSGGVHLMRRILEEHPESLLASDVRDHWSYYEELLRIEADRLPGLAAGDLRSLGRSVEGFRDRHGQYPGTLGPVTSGDVPLDPWGRAYAYRRQGQGYVLETLGRDGEPGGAGEDRDIRVLHGILRIAPS